MIRAEALSFAYPQQKDRFILENLNLSIQQGSFVAILGHNGCGKSTFAKHLNGILLPSGGKLWIGSHHTQEQEHLLEIRRQVGMVFQNPDNQIVATVVEEDIAFGPENLGVPPQEIRERVTQALEAVGMSEFRLHAPHLLSGGQKQRIAIAGVIAMEAKCIVLDEPTAMLDPQGRQEVMKTIRKLCEEKGVTVVLITHHMEEAALADRLIVMSEGVVQEDGSPEDVFQKVEKLEELGLDVPQTVKLLWELRQLGYDVPLQAMSDEACAQVLQNLLG